MNIIPKVVADQKSGSVYADSRDVAKYFGKDHGKVIRAIREMGCSAEFTQANFGLSEYKDRSGKKNVCYHMTKDGFAFLVMGFTGKEAARFKEAYITRFNEMESFIKDRLEARLMAPEMTAAIQQLKESEGKAAKAHHYSNEFNMINRIVMGIPASKIRAELGIDKAEPIRDHLYPEAVEAIRVLQQYNTGFIEAAISYDERKRHLELIFERRFSGKLLEAVLRECA